METVYDRMLLTEVRHVLCTDVQTAGAPVLGDLRHELRIPRER